MGDGARPPGQRARPYGRRWHPCPFSNAGASRITSARKKSWFTFDIRPLMREPFFRFARCGHDERVRVANVFRRALHFHFFLCMISKIVGSFRLNCSDKFMWIGIVTNLFLMAIWLRFYRACINLNCVKEVHFQTKLITFCSRKGKNFTIFKILYECNSEKYNH